jgi:hypothetical protein
MRLAPGVEGLVQKALRNIIETAYDRDFRRAQNELKLPNRDIGKVTLGKSVIAFRTMKAHVDFAFMSAALDDNWLKRLERFAEARNTFAHPGGAADDSQAITIDRGRHVLVEGIELVRWICTAVLGAHQIYAESLANRNVSLRDVGRSAFSGAVETIKLKPQNREFGIFLSHSSMDGEKAQNIAEALKALKYPVWYSEWAIEPGQSIVEKINEALDRNDTLIVLLSKHSVASEWVKRELNTALMSQLSGEAVTVLPILIEDCNIPATLRNIKYIDMRKDFQAGVIQLLVFLKERFRAQLNQPAEISK